MIRQSIIAAIAALALAGAGAFAQNVNNSGQTGNPLSQLGNHWMAGGVQPTLSSGCGTGAAIAGSDTAGHILLGSGTAQPCVMTFGQAFVAGALCVAVGESFTLSYNRTATVVNFTSLVDGGRIDYHCAARAGG